MEDYSFLQGQSIPEVLFVLLSVLIASYVYLSWRAAAHGTNVAHAKPPAHGRKMFWPLIPPTRSNFSASSRLRALWRKYKSPVSDWLAPVLVWLAVVWMTLAIVGFLLGES
jgi:hypothetical protein